jgi:hypothetical protein
MLSRVMNLLFQESDKPWGVEPSPVPNLDGKDLQAILTAVDTKAQQEGRQITDEEIEIAIRAFAAKRAERLETEIEDQLRELGGDRALDFVALCRKVILSGIMYGLGILKGPFITDQKQRTWARDPATGQLMAKNIVAERPRYEFIPIWDYYPDLSAKTFKQMDGQFTRVVMSRHQVTQLKERKDFFNDQIDRVLHTFSDGNYKRRSFETELRAMGPAVNVTQSERGKFEAVVWEGAVSGKDLRAAGVEVSDAQLQMDLKGTIWLFGDIVVKCELDPWTTLLGENNTLEMFHMFIFEEDESTLMGNGLPNVVRDSQMGLCAAVRMALDNGSIAFGQNLEINTDLLSMNQDITSIMPWKVWYREDSNPSTVGIPAVREIKFDSKLGELKVLADLFREFADQETFIGPQTGGDMSKGPSEPFRSATGASLLKGDAALPFKDVVRNVDVFLQSVVSSLITFNRQFNKNPALRGDFQAIAKGSTTLIAKEVLGMQLDNYAQTMTEEEKMYVNFHELAKARVRVRDLSTKVIIVDDVEATRREQAAQQDRAAQAEQQRRLAEATIKDVLSGVIKNISQASKNTAGAEAQTAQVILSALEKGISPHALASEATGARADEAAGAGAPVTGGAGAGGAGAVTAPGGEGSPAGGVPGVPEGAAAGGANAGFATAPPQP